MLIPNRTVSSTAYRYGFNGKEKDDELKGIGNSYDFGARMYDPRTGRWFAPDPLEREFSYVSTYVYALNNPLNVIDSDGRAPDPVIVKYFQSAINNWAKINAVARYNTYGELIYNKGNYEHFHQLLDVDKVYARLKDSNYLYDSANNAGIENESHVAGSSQFRFYDKTFNGNFRINLRSDKLNYAVVSTSFKGLDGREYGIGTMSTQRGFIFMIGSQSDQNALPLGFIILIIIGIFVQLIML